MNNIIISVSYQIPLSIKCRVMFLISVSVISEFG